MKYSALLIVAGFMLAGCFETTPVYMKHPETGETAKCGPYDNRAINSLASAQRERQCVQDFKEQGYVRVSQ